MKNVFITIAVIISFFAFIALVNEFELFGMKFWGVRKENARREIFEQTKSYVEGKNQALIKYHHEWVNADTVSKKAIEATIRHTFADFDANQIKDSELSEFLKKIQRE